MFDMLRSFVILRLLAPLALAILACFPTNPVLSQGAQSVLSQYLNKITPGEIVEGSDAVGAIRDDVPVAPLLSQGIEIGYVFITSDFVGTT